MPATARPTIRGWSLIGVTVHAAVFLEINKPRPVLLHEMVKGWLTGTEPGLGEMHHLAQPHRG